MGLLNDFRFAARSLARVKGLTLTCPKHQWAFDIATGRCIAKGDRPLTEFPHKVEKRRLLAFW